MIGADSFYFFNPWAGFVSGTRAMMADHQLLSDLLHELDGLIGCAHRSWIQDRRVLPRASPASFYLSGTVVSSTATSPERTAVWRFTPRGGDGVPHDVAGMGSQTTGGYSIGSVEFDGRSPCSLSFKDGALLEVNGSKVAPFGVWIGQPFDAAATGDRERPEVLLECAGHPPMPWPPADN